MERKMLFPSAAAMLDDYSSGTIPSKTGQQSSSILFPSAVSMMGEGSDRTTPGLVKQQTTSMLSSSDCSKMENECRENSRINSVERSINQGLITKQRNVFGSERFSSFPVQKFHQQQDKSPESSHSNLSSSESDGSYEEVIIDTKEQKKKKKKKSNKKRKKKRKRKYDSENSSENSDSETDSDDRDYREKKKRKSSKKKRKKKTKKTETKPAEAKIPKPNTIWLEDTKLNIEDAYRKDRRPDKENLEYGSLYKKDIAWFYPSKSQCLGIATDSNSSRRKKKTKKDKNTSLNSKGRYFSKLKGGVMDKKEDVELNEKVSEDTEFINEVESSVFIPIRGKLDPDYASRSSKNETLERQKEFSQQLLEDPSCVKTWIEFIDAQDELSPWLHDLKDQETWLSSRSLIDKKISITEKALLKNPASTELILKYMHLVKQVWTHEQMKERWKKFVFQFPNRSILWMEYLQHLQTELVRMTVSQVIDVYRKAFRMLLGIHNGDIKSHKREKNSIDGITMLLNQMIIFIWQAGWSEKATSTVHSFIEYNLTKPSAALINDNKKRDEFQRYFDDTGVRLGEEGYVSWENYMKQQGVHFPDKDVEITISGIGHQPKTKNVSFKEILKQVKQGLSNEGEDNKPQKNEYWTRLELTRMREECFSYHGDIEECEDTERVVLFDDLSLVCFSLESEAVVFQIVLTYLLLFGVSIPKSRYHKNLFKHSCKFLKIIESGSKCFCHSSDFCDFVNIEGTDFKDHLYFLRTFITHLLKLFKDLTILQTLSTVWFHMESILFRESFEDVSTELDKRYWKEMRKFLKSLLKLPFNRSFVPIWTMYAMYEWQIGNSEDAEKIYTTAIQLSRLNDSEPDASNALILRSLINLFISSHHKNVSTERSRILNLFCLFYGPTLKEQLHLNEQSPTINSLTMFKISRHLSEHFENLLATDFTVWKAFENDFLSIYVTFVYFYADFGVFTDTLDQILNKYEKSNSGFDYPDPLVYGMLLMREYNELNVGQFRTYSTYLERCFKMFPGNGVIFKFFMDANKVGVNTLNVRKMFDQCTKDRQDITPWLNYIGYEQQRLLITSTVGADHQVNFEILESRTSSHHRICSIYQRLLKTNNFSSCSQLWQDYMSFYLMNKNLKKAKDVMYTSLRNCPASKDLYLFGMKEVKNFQELYDLMMEKELRVKVITEELEVLLEE
eukprot:TCONS_00022514-protein